ncbi:zinc metalloprotease HtpX [Candidatus Bathyarchaeota archaeon]|nr:zinc metalloprotease HtpX [Candidatus Bathyarchaeota archaeon]
MSSARTSGAELQLSMLATLAAIIGVSTLFFTIVLSLAEAFNVFTLVIFVVGFNIVQWLVAPYLIDLMYKVKEASPQEQPVLHQIVERISKRSGLGKPRVMIANIPIPNAFAYGSPIAGTRLAVTTGLLRGLSGEEVEAVIGHELGHIRHKDVQVMMVVSVLPALMYYIGHTLSYKVAYGSRDRQRSSGLATIGALSTLLYFGLTLLSLYLSRLREYYADRHSVHVVDDGARKLSEALAKIVTYTGRYQRQTSVHNNTNGFKTLFISDPDNAQRDQAQLQSYSGSNDEDLVQQLLQHRTSALDSFTEVFSTHPNIIKRLRALQELR